MKKRTILVTGGNRGIGLAIVKGLAENVDDTILLGSRNMQEGEKEAGSIGKNVKAVRLDLSNQEQLATHIESIKQNHGQVEVLVNNAGVLKEGRFLDISDENFEESLRVNVLAVYQLVRAFVPDMIKNNYGRIINISSGWGSFEEGLTGPFAYSFAKASLNALTLTLSNVLPNNVKVNSMCPGWVRTRMGGMTAPRSPEKGAETAIWLANLDPDGPSGKFFRDKKLIKW